MNVLVCCEESQVVCKAFRSFSHNAFSCDLQPPSGGYPEWHIQSDCIPFIDGHCSFFTLDGSFYHIDTWDLIIAHPPCTYLSKAGATSMFPKPGVIDSHRLALALQAKDFFMKFYNCTCPKVCIENPTPFRFLSLPKESQVIQPYFFGEPYSKRTLLWLKGLPPLYPTLYLHSHVPYISTVRSSKLRSKTFSGIASAMASQWGSDFDYYQFSLLE